MPTFEAQSQRAYTNIVKCVLGYHTSLLKTTPIFFFSQRAFVVLYVGAFFNNAGMSHCYPVVQQLVNVS